MRYLFCSKWSIRIAEALNTRIKKQGLASLEEKNIACTYQLQPEAMECTQDIATAKKILQQVKEGMLAFAEKASSNKALVTIALNKTSLLVSVE